MLAAGLAALVVLGVVSALRPPPASTTPVVVARADLRPGTSLADADLVVAERPNDGLPDDAVRAPENVSGRILAAPVRAGEVVRARDVVADSLLGALGPGLVALPVRLSDDGVSALLQAGDVVDLVSAREDRAEVVADGVRVLAVPRPLAASSPVIGAGTSAGGGSLVIVAATTATALAVQRAAASGTVGVFWRAGRIR